MSIKMFTEVTCIATIIMGFLSVIVARFMKELIVRKILFQVIEGAAAETKKNDLKELFLRYKYTITNEFREDKVYENHPCKVKELVSRDFARFYKSEKLVADNIMLAILNITGCLIVLSRISLLTLYFGTSSCIIVVGLLLLLEIYNGSVFITNKRIINLLVKCVLSVDYNTAPSKIINKNFVIELLKTATSILVGLFVFGMLDFLFVIIALRIKFIVINDAFVINTILNVIAVCFISLGLAICLVSDVPKKIILGLKIKNLN